MLARIRRSAEDKDQGFTLIELLVVIIIIGILAAIAIPVFLNQRKKAVDSGIKADLRNAANVLESYYTNGLVYPAADATWATGTHAVGGTDTVVVSTGNSVAYVSPASYGVTDAFCLTGSNPEGSQTWVFKRDAGGLQPASVTSCA